MSVLAATQLLPPLSEDKGHFTVPSLPVLRSGPGRRSEFFTFCVCMIATGLTSQLLILILENCPHADIRISSSLQLWGEVGGFLLEGTLTLGPVVPDRAEA